MLICQPPVMQLEVTTLCCTTTHSYPGVDIAPEIPRPINNQTGITVGDLYDRTRELIETHGLCPVALWDDHDEEGYVKVQPR